MKIKAKSILLATAAVVVALALGLTGCRSGRQTSSQPGTTTAGSHYDATAAYDVLVGSYGEWHDVEMPVKLELQEPARFSASGKAVMVNGEAISLSLRKLGFEVARLYISPTDIMLVSKPMRLAYVESMEMFAHYTGLTLADIQNALLGRVFVPGSGAATASQRRQFDIAALPPGDVWTLTPRNAGRPLYFTVAEKASSDGDSDVILGGITVEAAGGVEIEMKDPLYTDCGFVPQSIEIAARYGSRSIDAAWRWTPGQAKWNRGTTVSAPEIPDGYRRLNTPALLSLLKNL